MNKLLLIFVVLLLLTACTSIWNSGDLHQWVIKQAVNSGCNPDSIVLNDWYTDVNGKNIWYGHCVNSKTAEPVKVEVGVDKVWKPSGS